MRSPNMLKFLVILTHFQVFSQLSQDIFFLKKKTKSYTRLGLATERQIVLKTSVLQGKSLNSLKYFLLNQISWDLYVVLEEQGQAKLFLHQHQWLRRKMCRDICVYSNLCFFLINQWPQKAMEDILPPAPGNHSVTLCFLTDLKGFTKRIMKHVFRLHILIILS